MHSHVRVSSRTGRAAPFILGMLLVVAGAAFFVTMAAGPDHDSQQDHPGTFAEIRVYPSRPQIPLDDRFEVYRHTQGKLLKAQFVLENAIQRPEVAKLELIQRQFRPVDWLEENLIVESSGEFIRLSLRGHRSGEAAAIVNAVVESYMHEVAKKESKDQRIRVTGLEKVALDVARQIDQLSAKKRRREQLAAPPAPEIEFFDLNLLRQEYTRLRLKRIELDPAMEPSADPNKATAEPDPQRRQLEAVKRQIEAFESEFRSVLKPRRASSETEIALDKIDREIATKEKILEQLREQIERMTIELDAPIGIEVFRKATF